MNQSKVKGLKKKEKVNLWFSKEKAQKGEYYFIPIDDGKKVVKCTGITLNKEPPSDSSEFLSAAYLTIIRENVEKKGSS